MYLYFQVYLYLFCILPAKGLIYYKDYRNHNKILRLYKISYRYINTVLFIRDNN